MTAIDHFYRQRALRSRGAESGLRMIRQRSSTTAPSSSRGRLASPADYTTTAQKLLRWQPQDACKQNLSKEAPCPRTAPDRMIVAGHAPQSVGVTAKLQSPFRPGYSPIKSTRPPEDTTRRAATLDVPLQRSHAPTNLHFVYRGIVEGPLAPNSLLRPLSRRMVARKKGAVADVLV